MIDRSGFEGVSCTARGACVAIDPSGAVVTSKTPARGAHSWSRPRLVDLNGLNNVDCAPAGLCLTVDDTGRVVGGRGG